MTTGLIIGSGAAAAGTALSSSNRENPGITDADISVHLESDREQLIEILGSPSQDEWRQKTAEPNPKQMAARGNSDVFGKLIFGSGYPWDGELVRMGLPSRSGSLTVTPAVTNLIGADQVVVRLGVSMRAFTARGSTVESGAR